MRLHMVIHPSNFRSQCYSYMEVFYHFIYAYCVRACVRVCVRARAFIQMLASRNLHIYITIFR